MPKLFFIGLTGVGSASALPSTLSVLSWRDRYKVEDFGSLIISKSDRKFENYCYYAVPSTTVDRLLKKFGGGKENSLLKKYTFKFDADPNTKYGVVGKPNKGSVREECLSGKDSAGYGSGNEIGRLSGFLMGIKVEDLKEPKAGIVIEKGSNLSEEKKREDSDKGRQSRKPSRIGTSVSWCFPYSYKGGEWANAVEKKYGIGGTLWQEKHCLWSGWSKTSNNFSEHFNKIKWQKLVGIWLKER